ncbi:MAG: DUF547 domain-containing protein [Magnetococcales bacterium]|nr:DUF547 domain-containing protein [Magnetococcales bacterium]NGZ26298.1 DUF547 domain-containing protein [Magnetococcales bacterium]
MFRLLVVLMSLLPFWLWGEEPDWTPYAKLLERHLSSQSKNNVSLNMVAYGKVKEDPLFAKVLEMVANHPADKLTTPAEKMAFYINAYNIMAIKVVVDNWPLQSIRDAGGFITPVWKVKVGVVAGQEVHLDLIEHKILRPMGDPRIHMALVCASVSCPDLRAEPYTAARLSQQLDNQTTVFLNNTGKGLRLEGKEAQVSVIFEWFGQDFESQGGVDAFIQRYHPLPEKVEIHAGMPYDWSVNGQ